MPGAALAGYRFDPTRIPEETMRKHAVNMVQWDPTGELMTWDPDGDEAFSGRQIWITLLALERMRQIGFSFENIPLVEMRRFLGLAPRVPPPGVRWKWCPSYITRRLGEVPPLVDPVFDPMDGCGGVSAAVRLLGLTPQEGVLLAAALACELSTVDLQRIFPTNHLGLALFQELRTGGAQEFIPEVLTALNLPTDLYETHAHPPSKQAVRMHLHLDPRTPTPVALGLFSVLHVVGRALLDDAGAATIDTILSGFFDPRFEEHPIFPLDSFRGFVPDIDLAKALLASRAGRTTRILVTGPPGTGKTEFARALLASAGLRANFAVTSPEALQSATDFLTAGISMIEYRKQQLRGEAPISEHADRRGRPDPSWRIQMVLHLQQLLAHTQDHALVLDEFDVSPDVFYNSDGHAVSRGLANQMLEEASVPLVVIANTVHGMDGAILRRFDLVIHVEAMSRATRRHLLEEHLGDVGLLPIQMRGLENYVDLTVADIVALKALYARSHAHLGDAAGALLDHFEERTRLLGRPWRRRRHDHIGDFFTLKALHTTVRPDELVRALMVDPRSTKALFYGVPGTGKTALAHWLAERVGMELIFVRASSWLSKWVGETEAQMAAAFRRAERENAILYIDECDSFLREREAGAQVWELSQVNELLSQLEQSHAAVILSTNLEDALDRAVVRRIPLLVEFKPTRAEAFPELLRGALDTLGVTLPDPCSTLEDVTRDLVRFQVVPGDLAQVVARQRLTQMIGVEPNASNAYLTAFAAAVVQTAKTRQRLVRPAGFQS